MTLIERTPFWIHYQVTTFRRMTTLRILWALTVVCAVQASNYADLLADLQYIYNVDRLQHKLPANEYYTDDSYSDKISGDWHVSYPDTLSNPTIKEARDYGEAVLRDQEYMKQLPISGYQFISGGTGRQDDQSEVKTDRILPSYCTPPNPCPQGYTGEDNCVRDFINTPENNRHILYEQDCPCDAEHMLSCPQGMKTIDPKSGFFSDDALDNDLDDLGSLESLHNIDLSSGQERFVDMYPALNKEKLDDINPYLYGEAKRIAAKKQVPKTQMK